MTGDALTVKTVIEMTSHLIGGLAIFLLGMKYMSDGVQATAGEKLRKMIAMITDNRLAGCATGTFVTSLIQSSSVTTVMLIGLVNAGVMTLMQAIGVILGADLGTTITAWIVAVKITKYGLAILGASGFIYLFSKGERTRFFAMIIMGIGMVFFGLQLMSKGMVPLRTNEQFVALFTRFSPKDYFGVIKCVIMGSLVTAIVQSSSATIAITIMLARTGVIDYPTAVALVLGENIGTTITAFIASLGMTTNARRVAYAHITMKILGVTLMIPFFFLYMGMLTRIMPETIDIAKRIALAHTLFNVMLVCTFLPFTHYLGRMLLTLVKSKPYEEKTSLTHLDIRILDASMLSIEQSRGEILRMGEIAKDMMVTLGDILREDEKNREKITALFNQEEIMDSMQKEVVVFLTHLLTLEVSTSIAREAHLQLRRADEYESISDYCTAILKMHLRLDNVNLHLADAEKNDLDILHNRVLSYFELILTAHHNQETSILEKARPEGEAITHTFRQIRERHLENLCHERMEPLVCTVYPDMLTSYRRIKEHLFNVAEAIAGEK